MKKGEFLGFLNSDQNKKKFDVSEYNDKRNIELKSQIKNIKFDEVEELYSLLDQYKENKDKNILNIIKSKIEFNLYDIKGICHKIHESLSSSNIYTEGILDQKKYNIEFNLYKIINKENNKKIITDKNKYTIILLNINEEIKTSLGKTFLNFPRVVLLFTNLKVSLELDSFGKYSFLFKSNYKTKIYMEKNNADSEKAKNNFISSGIYIDLLKSNEFSYLSHINSQKLFLLKENKFKNSIIKGTNFIINLDLKKFLEIETETLYIENSTNKNSSFLDNTISLCCLVKTIYKNRDKKIVNIILENLFDLNSIILEIPTYHKILENIHANCIQLFINFRLFVDEKMNIKLTVNNNMTDMTENSKVLLLYFLIDIEKYNNKKIKDFLIHNSFSQLISSLSENKLIRINQKYIVMINKINYINLYFSNEGKEITYYDGCMQCSDGTSSGYFHIKGKDVSELKKLQININYYLANKSISDNKVTIYPNIIDVLQIIIIGSPFMENVKELSFLDIHESIHELKNIKDKKEKKENILKFDLYLTRNEYTIINGSFLKKSKFLEEIPNIKVLKYFTLEEYINLIGLQNNKLTDNL